MNLALDRQAQQSPDPDPKEVFLRSGFVLVAAVPTVVFRKLVRANNTTKVTASACNASAEVYCLFLAPLQFLLRKGKTVYVVVLTAHLIYQ